MQPCRRNFVYFGAVLSEEQRKTLLMTWKDYPYYEHKFGNIYLLRAPYAFFDFKNANSLLTGQNIEIGTISLTKIEQLLRHELSSELSPELTIKYVMHPNDIYQKEMNEHLSLLGENLEAKLRVGQCSCDFVYELSVDVA